MIQSHNRHIFMPWLGHSYITPNKYPDNKFHGANMGPTWVLTAPDGPHEPCYKGIYECVEITESSKARDSFSNVNKQWKQRCFQIIYNQCGDMFKHSSKRIYMSLKAFSRNIMNKNLFVFPKYQAIYFHAAYWSFMILASVNFWIFKPLLI